MQFINIYDAKTHLSQYLEKIASDEEEIIICKHGKPIAKLVKYETPKKRQLGLGKGQITIAEDFESLPDEFMDYFS
ncbi:Antitoxin of toxin-antitoxin stability system (plasmid) [Legionella adelaidensis]|uniref:Antitoxin n=1 Tax=Legionella adelaidensis TaxID=45056 RepID=A0A0W0R2U8_9GAMM|nr:type II toxin-antitoxin system prevent-host-death family antitoxin [Legionella adelaidensis]KTC65326.1 hypothetical protein Lade_1348 [Legionella adelaidensis]VEH86023.1 Antitoxin of toxin-antitoxin stability system [Legionella adelaidensis]